MNALTMCLQSLTLCCYRINATLHCPRIGYNTEGYDWYKIERLIKRNCVEYGISTYIYYYSHQMNNNSNSNSVQNMDPELNSYLYDKLKSKIDWIKYGEDSNIVRSFPQWRENVYLY